MCGVRLGMRRASGFWFGMCGSRRFWFGMCGGGCRLVRRFRGCLVRFAGQALGERRTGESGADPADR
ncbi:hypothetical protein GCM10022222_15980 [Amycolatopsis ultiminotia]|uniref:Uncharacterized protein n=1 Tax=Amycolatopsis ultiminotia TaxID=543629 RepID=A0ABP6VEP1_9PSEU